MASFEDALRVEAVIEAIRKSSSEKKWVKVNVQTQPDILLTDKSKLFLSDSWNIFSLATISFFVLEPRIFFYDH